MRRTALLLSVAAVVMLLASAAMGAIVAVCHVPPGNPAKAKTVLVGVKAADAHLKNHAGDFLGFCACQVDEDCDDGEECNLDTGECQAPPSATLSCNCIDEPVVEVFCGTCPLDVDVEEVCANLCASCGGWGGAAECFDSDDPCF